MFFEISPRALRRHHVARLKKSRSDYWGHVLGLEWEPQHLGAVVQHPCICSCWMCGNPRKWVGERTLQERREMQENLWQLLCVE